MTEHLNHEHESAPQQFKIQVVNREKEYFCEQGKSLLVGMEQVSSHYISVGCRGGGCGVCKIRILDGEYTNKRMSKAHISEKDKAEGFALACRVFPTSDMVIESDHYDQPPTIEETVKPQATGASSILDHI